MKRRNKNKKSLKSFVILLSLSIVVIILFIFLWIPSDTLLSLSQVNLSNNNAYYSPTPKPTLVPPKEELLTYTNKEKGFSITYPKYVIDTGACIKNKLYMDVPGELKYLEDPVHNEIHFTVVSEAFGQYKAPNYQYIGCKEINITLDNIHTHVNMGMGQSETPRDDVFTYFHASNTEEITHYVTNLVSSKQGSEHTCIISQQKELGANKGIEIFFDSKTLNEDVCSRQVVQFSQQQNLAILLPFRGIQPTWQYGTQHDYDPISNPAVTFIGK